MSVEAERAWELFPNRTLLRLENVPIVLGKPLTTQRQNKLGKFKAND